jgi:anti-sigma B factor antagonist
MSDFSIRTKEYPPTWMIELKGYLDAHTAPRLEETFTEMIEAGNTNLIVDFEDLEYISSAGLGVFMAFIEDVRECKGDIKLAGMSPKVYNVFDLLGFPMLYDICGSPSEARDRFLEEGSQS